MSPRPQEVDGFPERSTSPDGEAQASSAGALRQNPQVSEPRLPGGHLMAVTLHPHVLSLPLRVPVPESRYHVAPFTCKVSPGPCVAGAWRGPPILLMGDK